MYLCFFYWRARKFFQEQHPEIRLLWTRCILPKPSLSPFGNLATALLLSRISTHCTALHFFFLVEATGQKNDAQKPARLSWTNTIPAAVRIRVRAALRVRVSCLLQTTRQPWEKMCKTRAMSKIWQQWERMCKMKAVSKIWQRWEKMCEMRGATGIQIWIWRWYGGLIQCINYSVSGIHCPKSYARFLLSLCHPHFIFSELEWLWGDMNKRHWRCKPTEPYEYRLAILIRRLTFNTRDGTGRWVFVNDELDEDWLAIQIHIWPMIWKAQQEDRCFLLMMSYMRTLLGNLDVHLALDVRDMAGRENIFVVYAKVGL